MTIKHDLHALAVVLLTTVMVGVFVLDAREELRIVVVVFAWILIAIASVSLVGVSYERLKALRLLSLHTVKSAGKQYLLVQMGQYSAVVDFAHVNDAVTMISTANSTAARSVVGNSWRVGHLRAQTLFPALPRVEVFEDDDFDQTYLKN